MLTYVIRLLLIYLLLENIDPCYPLCLWKCQALFFWLLSLQHPSYDCVNIHLHLFI